MNEQKEVILERKANETVKVINSAFSVIYAGGVFTLCAHGRVIANCDTMAAMLESAKVHNGNRL